MSLKNVIIITALLLLASAPALAIYEKGGPLIPGAEPSALGGAYAAGKGDATVIFYNPAGLVSVEGFTAGAMYGSLLGTKRNNTSFLLSNYFSPVVAMALSGSILSGNGSYENIFAATAAVPLYRDLNIQVSSGVNLKLLYAYFNETAAAAGADFGLNCAVRGILLSDETRFGLCVQDIQTVIRSKNGYEEKVPLMFKGGAAYEIKGFTILSDYELTQRFSPGRFEGTYRGGLEKRFGQVSLRAGYAGSRVSRVSGGLGARWEYLDADYSYTADASGSGAAHKIDLKFVFGPEEKEWRDDSITVESFPGDGKAYIKWESTRDADEYRIYIRDAEGRSYIRSLKGGRRANFLIEGAQNGVKYAVTISALSAGSVSARTADVQVIPLPMSDQVKEFYKRAKVYYIDNEYKKALNELENALKRAKDADVKIFSERIEKLMDASAKKEK